MKVKVTEYTYRNGPIQQQISTSMNDIPEHFSPALNVFRIHISNLFCKLDIVGQSPDVQQLQWRHTMANI